MHWDRDEVRKRNLRTVTLWLMESFCAGWNTDLRRATRRNVDYRQGLPIYEDAIGDLGIVKSTQGGGELLHG